MRAGDGVGGGVVAVVAALETRPRPRPLGRRRAANAANAANGASGTRTLAADAPVAVAGSPRETTGRAPAS